MKNDGLVISHIPRRSWQLAYFSLDLRLVSGSLFHSVFPSSLQPSFDLTLLLDGRKEKN